MFEELLCSNTKKGGSVVIVFVHYDVMDAFGHGCNPTSRQCMVNLGQNDIQLPKKQLGATKNNIIQLP
jgi:hypothetical protein